jgi:hypothetical protein
MAGLNIQVELKNAADLLRLGREAEGNSALTRIIERLQTELGSAGPTALAPLFATLEAMMLAQERGDVLFVADLLEFELAKMLVET